MKSIFKKKIIKSALFDRNGGVVECENIQKEFNELKSNYIFTSKSGNRIYKYHIIRHTWRSPFCNKLNIKRFDKTTYTIITNLKFNGEYIKFDTDNLICMSSQIDFHLEIIQVLESGNSF